MSGLLFIISAPSGSGKSTLVNEVRNSVPGLEFSVSYTTRKPRGSELNGREYYYVDKEQFHHAVETYYAICGWNPKTGFPSEGKLIDMDLQWIRNNKALPYKVEPV